MKKLLLSAAAAVIAAGAYAGCTTPTPVPGTVVTDVYDFRATVKTIANKSTTTKAGVDDCGTTIPGGAYCYRVTASRQFKGVFISCDCASFGAGTAFFYIATSENKYSYVDSNIVGTSGTAGYSWTLLNFYGSYLSSKSNLAQGLLNLTFRDVVSGYTDPSTQQLVDISKIYVLQAAGFGTQKNAKVASLAGQITGFVTPATCNCSAAVPLAFDPCTLLPNVQPNAVGGTFTLKYNASLSKYATANDVGATGMGVAVKVFGTGAFYNAIGAQ